MTVIYTEDLASAQDFSVFWRILTLWKGSIYKMIWPNMLLYVASYGALSLCYRTMMTDAQRHNFELLVYYCRNNIEKIKVPFFLGFFVTEVYNRWWNQFFTLAWPDGSTVSLAGNMDGMDRMTRTLRRQIARYCDLAFAFLMRNICPLVADRLKRRAKMVDHGMMTEDEANEMRRLRMDDEYRPHFVVCLQWAALTAARSRKDNYLKSDEQLCQFLDTLSGYHEALILSWLYNWICMPMSYCQVVTLVVYTYYFGQLIAQQYLTPRRDCFHEEHDYYFPLYLFTQFFFFMGWLKTAEELINPYGEDDDDLDMNWIIDRHFEFSCLACDTLTSEEPKALFDWYWSHKFPDQLAEEARQRELDEEIQKKKTELEEFARNQHEEEESEIIAKIQQKESDLQALIKESLDRKDPAGHREDMESESGSDFSDALDLPEFDTSHLMEGSVFEEVKMRLSSPKKYEKTKGFVGVFGSVAKHFRFLRDIRKGSAQRKIPTSNEDIQYLESIAKLSEADFDKILCFPADKMDAPPLITLEDAAEYFGILETDDDEDEVLSSHENIPDQ